MTTILQKAPTLDANLAALGQRNSDIAEQIMQAHGHEEMHCSDTTQGVPCGIYRDRQLCSRHRPLDEADRLVDSMDLVENATVVVLGFGMGYHVQRLAEKFQKAGLVIVFEPDVQLLRAVLEQVDHSSWLSQGLVLFLTDPDDRGILGSKLAGAESILGQGVAFLEHPAASARIGEQGQRFREMFSDYISTAKTTLLTTLMRSVDTVRNLLFNLDHYAAGPGVEELHKLTTDRLGIVVSAGPSLHNNLHLLNQPGVRDRCIIIAVQTTLKPLLAAGIKPHFVTALDFHEISRRFYDDLPADELQDVTLVADPKAHPVILDAYPGPVRCYHHKFLDLVLGPLERPMGELPGGATVANLAVYLAHYLGCNPIALIGQDLGFSDGLYYAPGTAIHQVWAPELNPFNTIAMMEWQRVVRHRLHLQSMKDVHGKSIYTDAQMLNYLQQFERDFAQYIRDGIHVIDATEGGLPKQHTNCQPLADVLDEYANEQLPAIPIPPVKLDADRLHAVQKRIRQVRQDVAAIRVTSRKTTKLIDRMMQDQHDQRKMKDHFQKIERYRQEVKERFTAFEIINHLNQLGVFNRLKTDRRLHMQQDLTPLERQRGQLERDRENVQWTIDAAEELLDQFDQCDRLLAGKSVDFRPRIHTVPTDDSENEKNDSPSNICALIPVDPVRNGLGQERSLADSFGKTNVLQATLCRLGQSQYLESIVLLCPDDMDVETLIDRDAIKCSLEIERCGESPFPPEQEAIAVGRLWAQHCWRGGIAGLSVYDEVLCPQTMHEIMQKRGITAALLVAPDWPLLDVTSTQGCDAVIRRHLEHPEQHNLVFTQAPPGLCGCVISATLMSELAQRNRLATVGGLLVYQPHAPQGDPIARDANVQVDHHVRQAKVRATCDTPRQQQVLQTILSDSTSNDVSSGDIVSAITKSDAEQRLDLPAHLILELTTMRQSWGQAWQHPYGEIQREPISFDLVKEIFAQFSKSPSGCLTLAGVGDPLLHEHFDKITHAAKDAGLRAVHIRTELRVDQSQLDRLMASPVDVISVDLHADRANTYRQMMGQGNFKFVLDNLQYILPRRRFFTDKHDSTAIALPWIVPRLQRHGTTYEDIESFFDRWQQILGTAVIEAPPRFETEPVEDHDSLISADDPSDVMQHKLAKRMTILSDGSVPISELDLPGNEIVGNITNRPLKNLWHDLLDARSQLPPSQLRTRQP